MSETSLNLRRLGLRVSVGAEFFLFSEEFAANSKIVGVRAGQAGLGRETGGQRQGRARTLTEESPGQH